MEALKKKFDEMGARLKVRNIKDTRFRFRDTPFILDVGNDKKGEFFDLITNGEVDVQVVDLQEKDRHLLLSVIEGNDRPGTRPSIQKFLCGHDERHWFAAGVRDTAASVDSAKQSLKPGEVVDSQKKRNVKHKNRHKRKNKGYIRQGEWFFIPVDNPQVDEKMILRREPMQRGRGKPHMAEELYRHGGETVHVHRLHAPNGITPKKFKTLDDKIKKEWGWTVMTRNPEVLVRGKIRHPDHKTLVLQGWHKVVANREVSSQNLAFLD